MLLNYCQTKKYKRNSKLKFYKNISTYSLTYSINYTKISDLNHNFYNFSKESYYLFVSFIKNKIFPTKYNNNMTWSTILSKNFNKIIFQELYFKINSIIVINVKSKHVMHAHLSYIEIMIKFSSIKLVPANIKISNRKKTHSKTNLYLFLVEYLLY